MRIDSHQHFWKYDPQRDSWITDGMKVLKNDFLPSELKLLLEENSFNGCVAVQADQSEDETEFLLELANQNLFIKGVVGWVDFRKKNIGERLSYFSTHKKLKGFRHIVQGEPDGFLLNNQFQLGIAHLAEFNFTYDIVISSNQLTEAFTFVQKFPNQKFVIDHLAKPSIKENRFDFWKQSIAPFSVLENVYCKLSGLVTEANWTNWNEIDFKPYLDEIINVFGINRIMYGSDWPVCLLAASYQKQLSVIENYFQSFSDYEKEKIFGKNAIQFYNL